MATETACLRCGGGRVISAQLERPIAFCVDHATQHGLLHLSMKATICEDCGHVEFSVADPSRLVRPPEQAEDTIVQEEDF